MDRVGAARSPWLLPALVAAAGVLIGSLYAEFGKALPLLTDDSNSYVIWATTRSPGYPAFLALLEAMPGFALAHIGRVQVALLVLATAFLADAVSRLTGRRAAGALLALAIYAQRPLWGWALQVRPEIPFIALIEVWFGALALAFRSGGSRSAVAAGLALGGAILVRPVGIGFLPALLVAGIALAQRFGARAGVATVTPALAMLLACSVGNGLLRGYFSPQAFSGLTLLAKTAPLLPSAGYDDPFTPRLAHEMAPLRAALVDADLHTAYWLSRQAYDVTLYRRYVPMSRTAGYGWVEANSIALRASLAALSGDLAGYARLVAVQWWAMWTRPWLSTPGRVARAQAAVTSPELAAWLGDKAKLSDLDLVPAPLYWAKVWLLLALALVCALAPVLAALDRWRDPTLVLAGIAGISVHSYQLLVGAVEYADNRYANAVVPQIAIALVLAGCALAERAGRRREPEPPSISVSTSG